MLIVQLLKGVRFNVLQTGVEKHNFIFELVLYKWRMTLEPREGIGALTPMWVTSFYLPMVITSVSYFPSTRNPGSNQLPFSPCPILHYYLCFPFTGSECGKGDVLGWTFEPLSVLGWKMAVIIPFRL
jgi:hypothetical protein